MLNEYQALTKMKLKWWRWYSSSKEWTTKVKKMYAIDKMTYMYDMWHFNTNRNEVEEKAQSAE